MAIAPWQSRYSLVINIGKNVGLLNSTVIRFLYLYFKPANFNRHVFIFFHSDFKSRGESPGIPLPPNILDKALGRFFIKSSGEVKGIPPIPIPKWLCVESPPPPLADLDSLGSIN